MEWNACQQSDWGGAQTQQGAATNIPIMCLYSAIRISKSNIEILKIVFGQ